MKVPISLLLRLLGRWCHFLRFALLLLLCDTRLLSRLSRDVALVSSRPLGGCRGILACVAIIELRCFLEPRDLVQHSFLALNTSCWRCALSRF